MSALRTTLPSYRAARCRDDLAAKRSVLRRTAGLAGLQADAASVGRTTTAFLWPMFAKAAITLPAGYEMIVIVGRRLLSQCACPAMDRVMDQPTLNPLFAARPEFASAHSIGHRRVPTNQTIPLFDVLGGPRQCPATRCFGRHRPPRPTVPTRGRQPSAPGRQVRQRARGQPGDTP
jgi:hypothetical protein